MIVFTFRHTSGRARTIGLALGVGTIAALAAFCCSRGIDLANAWDGWAPPGYVWACNDAETFLKLDFMQEYNLFMGNSLAMRAYPLAYAWWGMEPQLAQYVFISLTALLYTAAMWLLTSTLIPRVSPVVLGLVIGIALLTEAANGDLARFGQAKLSLGQAYGVAIPLQVIALALALRGRLLSVGVVLGLLACVHLTLGAITAVVVAAMLCWPPGMWRNWRLWTAGAIVMACALAWAFGVVGVAGGGYAHMETATWVHWMRFANLHWFPFDIGVFTVEHYSKLTPFLALAILAACHPVTDMATPAVRRGWIIGLAASTVITIIGLVVSLHPVSPSLVMTALHRASGVTLLLLLPMAVSCLVRFLERGSAVAGAVAAMAIACPFFGAYGVPLFPVLVLAGFKLLDPRDGEISRWQRGLLITLAVAAIGYALFLILAGHASVRHMAFVGRREAWLVAVAFFAGRIVLAIVGRWRPYPEGVAPAVVMLLAVILLCGGVRTSWRAHPKVPRTEAQAYLEAQTWARENTPQHALFMIDPARSYGWKDCSRRASYGNFRDWMHSVICYRADASKLAEGLRRARRLGVDPESYLARAVATAELFPGCAEYRKMSQDIRSAYYQLRGVDLLDLARDEGIDYFVFELKYAKLLPLKPVYQNTHFSICEPVLQEH